RLIGQFLEMMLAERGSSSHTIDAYRRDLDDFLEFIAARASLETVSREDIEKFLAALVRKKISPKSSARKLSAIRQLFQFLFNENLRQDTPAATIETPKLGRQLPHTLTVSDVSALLDAARADDSPQGIRLQAMLELMYGAGLRVSELVGLKL